MNVSAQIAKHLREVYFGGNWTWVYLKEHLDGLSWEQATTQVAGLNTIARLVYHINYYVEAQIKVLQGGPLESSDKFAFDVPPISTQEEWEALLKRPFEYQTTIFWIFPISLFRSRLRIF